MNDIKLKPETNSLGIWAQWRNATIDTDLSILDTSIYQSFDQAYEEEETNKNTSEWNLTSGAEPEI